MRYSFEGGRNGRDRAALGIEIQDHIVYPGTGAKIENTVLFVWKIQISLIHSFIILE
jgi:hypothetical protein